MVEGSEREDAGTRASNHFHEPINNTGLNDINWGDSALSWALGDISSNEYSWKKARTYYCEALTSQSSNIRSWGFDKTFRSLGYVMHMIQDVAAPAHTRNDFKGHLFPQNGTGLNFTSYFGNNFEQYVQRRQAQGDLLYNYMASGSVPVFNLGLPMEARFFWDTGLYTGDDINDSFNNGIAEYSSANFLSAFRLLDEPGFPHPTKADTDYDTIDWANPEIVDAEDGVTDHLIYVRKIEGQSSYRLMGVRYLTSDHLVLVSESQLFTLDDNCHKDYAQKLLPKAVGYSAGVLDYFFRGTLEVTEPAIIGGDSSGITKIKAKVINTTGSSGQIEAMPGGKLFAVAKYKTDPAEEPFSYAVSDENTEAGELSTDAADPTEVTFIFSSSKVPADFYDLTVQVGYYGTIGQETDTGVAVSTYVELKKEYALVKIEGRGVTRAFVWDPLKDRYADIKKTDGSQIIFPCDVQNLNEWQSLTGDIGRNLYTAQSFPDRTLTCDLGDPGCSGSIASCEESTDSGLIDFSGSPLMNYIFISNSASCEECCPYYSRSYESEAYFGYNLNCNNKSGIRTGYIAKHTALSAYTDAGVCDGECTSEGTYSDEYEASTLFGPLYKYSLSGYNHCDTSYDGVPSSEDEYTTSVHGENALFANSTILHIYYFQYLLIHGYSNCATHPYNIPVECGWDCHTTYTYQKSNFDIHAQIDILDGDNKNPLELNRKSSFENAIGSLKTTWSTVVGTEPVDTLYEYKISATLRK